jgi:hypothetical protein
MQVKPLGRLFIILHINSFNKNKLDLKISKRDISFFALGFFTLFLIETIIDWDNVKKEFMNGWNSIEKVEKKT